MLVCGGAAASVRVAKQAWGSGGGGGRGSGSGGGKPEVGGDERKERDGGDGGGVPVMSLADVNKYIRFHPTEGTLL